MKWSWQKGLLVGFALVVSTLFYFAIEPLTSFDGRCGGGVIFPTIGGGPVRDCLIGDYLLYQYGRDAGLTVVLGLVSYWKQLLLVLLLPAGIVIIAAGNTLRK